MTLSPIRVVEAALFSSGKPLLVEEIAQATKLEEADVKSALKELQQEYAGRDTALEVGRIRRRAGARSRQHSRGGRGTDDRARPLSRADGAGGRAAVR